MRLFKSIFSIIIVLAIVFCTGLTAAADGSSYSIEIPDGFAPFQAEGQDAAWKNADGSIIINLAISQNTSKVKVNPNDAGESYMTLVENEIKASVVSTDKFNGEIIDLNSALMELGEHDAIRAFMRTKYTFDKGEMEVYQLCYLFETQNYIHSFVITGDSDISDFGDGLIKTVQINDEAVPLRSTDDNGGGLLSGIIKGAIIGAAVGIALTLITKLSGKRAKKQPEEAPPEIEEPVEQEPIGQEPITQEIE